MTNKVLIAGIAAGTLVLGLVLVPFSMDQYAEGKRIERIFVTKNIESMQSPFNETHQIAILLPPQEGILYSGRFTYTASAPVQVLIMHDRKPDMPYMSGATIIEGDKNGSVSFAGQGLALHTSDGTKFTATVTMHAQARAMMGQLPTMMPKDMMGKQQDMMPPMQQLYNPDLNPKQVNYPAVMGFNDLHIEAIRHLKPNGDTSKLQVIVHHHCKVYDDMTAACLLFPTGMADQDKPYGIEYVITAQQYAELPEEEKQYWHYHKTEFPRAQATFPDMDESTLAKVKPILDETYGKVFYFWQFSEEYPVGEPEVLVIQHLPEQP